MPERPDLEYVVPELHRALAGREIAGVEVAQPVVLRLAVPGTPAELLAGQRIAAVARRAHFVLFDLRGAGDLELVVSPMLAGRFQVAEPGAKAPRDLALALPLSDGRALRYRDDVAMGKVYVLPRGRWDLVPGLSRVGLDVLDPERFTREAFRALARGRREQVKVFLMDKAALDSMGNAYADEVLWEAGLHPKTPVGRLSPERLDRLHDAIERVIGHATRVIAERRPPLDEKLRDFLSVRGHKGQPCPRCGAKVRTAGVHGHDAFFCPSCQPDETGRALVDWRKAGGPGPGRE